MLDTCTQIRDSLTLYIPTYALLGHVNDKHPLNCTLPLTESKWRMAFFSTFLKFSVVYSSLWPWLQPTIRKYRYIEKKNGCHINLLKGLLTFFITSSVMEGCGFLGSWGGEWPTPSTPAIIKAIKRKVSYYTYIGGFPSIADKKATHFSYIILLW